MSEIDKSIRKKLYHRYRGMIHRCYYPSTTGYHRYGGRGVKVCDEWMNDMEAFIKWSIGAGFEPHLELDKDIKGDGMLYGPDTCLWVTRIENQRHKRSTRYFQHKGKKCTILDVAEMEGLPCLLLEGRIIGRRKMSIEDAIALGGKRSPINQDAILEKGGTWTLERINSVKPKDSRLTAVGIFYKKNTWWARCQCSCGREKDVYIYNIINNIVKSCGCLVHDILMKRNVKYIGGTDKLKDIYQSMIAKCYHPQSLSYHNFGSIGVTVCDEWKSNGQFFINWAMAAGYTDGLELFKDKKHMVYSPETCSIAKAGTRQLYKTTTRIHEYNGAMYTLGEISEMSSVPLSLLQSRTRERKMTAEAAVKMGKDRLDRIGLINKKRLK